MPCIEAHGLRKAFGTTVALDGVELRVEEGRILGLPVWPPSWDWPTWRRWASTNSLWASGCSSKAYQSHLPKSSEGSRQPDLRAQHE